ncbi:HD-GYP domain-containing protein [Stutzerimonas stutzeri]|uniref:Phosphodiesterase n=1 Tax=Stutzerimonas stutzeri KOS6 TaxID=1218352 RepID=A0A061JU83_STUST|nr:HD-GYP domain-containing protein [Stutzerimonas stutzeri]EWC41744.1 phosphodiesterase [Stutzerimonas stutzeri KOS6]
MLRKILVSQLRFGMYVHSVEGSWFDHPFWRSKFLLTDPADLQTLQRSGVGAVWIDIGKGVDVDTAAVATDAPQPFVEAAPAAVRPAAPAVQQCSVEEELQRATKLLNRSKQQVTSLFNEARLGKAVDPQQCLPLVEQISASLARNGSALLSLARLKTKDEYTYMHSVAVCALMVALGRQLGLSEHEVQEAGLAGLLHDIGKMAMPLDVLNKPGKLSDDEYAIMRSHPERGHAMLLAADTAVSEAVLDVCLHHHEKIDGTGYPHGLAGEQISQLARMGPICDVYDAITSDRPYKRAWDASGSLARMAQWQGHFDTKLLHAFVRTVGIYPLGSLVRLQSGRLGVVIEHNARQLTAPRLKLFYSTRSRANIPPVELDLSSPQCSDRIVGREDPAAWGFTHLDELWT